MFSILNNELRPYNGQTQLDWRAPLTPKKYTKKTSVNRHLKSRNRRVNDEYDQDRRKRMKKASKHHSAPLSPIPVIDYSFIRRDADYEPFVSEIWHDQISRGWPRAIPYTTTQGINVAVRQCIKFISADDSAYYILLCGGIIGYTSSRHNAVNIKTLPRLFHKVRIQAVRALRDAIARVGDTMPTDSLMASLLSFALQETVYDNDVCEGPQWPKSPLANAQLLNWVGGLQKHSHHLEAFYQLLERRGGLHTVTEPGLRRMIYLCDLLVSSIGSTNPRYPIYGSSQSLVTSSKLLLDDEASELSRSFAHKFKGFSSLSWQFLEPFMELLPDLRDVTAAVDMHQRTRGESPQLGQLVDPANSLQWRILSLCHQDNEKNGESSSDSRVHSEGTTASHEAMMNAIVKQTLEPVRLATLVYSSLVIFPVSFNAGVRTQLACALRDLYEDNQVRIYEPELEMWIIAMGCLASWGLNERTWYLSRLKSMTEDLCCPEVSAGRGKEPTLSVFLEIMRGFLWWEHTCALPMREIWDEMYGAQV